MNAAAVAQVRDFVNLTKPRIGLLVLLTAYSAMCLAAGNMPEPGLAFFTLLGIALAAGSSNVLNNYFDRDVDRLMQRTRNRPIPCGRIHPHQAMAFGLALGFVSFAILVSAVNLLAALLAIGTIAFYVGVYTLWLKRTSPLCTLVGGVAGALPPVIGWAAVTGGIEPPALGLFAILLLWQPPHFWTIALTRREEYRNANLPMLPVVRGVQATKLRMLLYTASLLPVSLSLYWFGLVGLPYVAVAVVAGGTYLALTVDFARRPISSNATRRLFPISILYLAVLLIAMVLDAGMHA